MTPEATHRYDLPVFLLALAVFVGALFWLAASIPNPVKLFDDVIIQPRVAAAKAQIAALVAECRAEQAAADLKTSPTTSPRCHPLGSIIRSGQPVQP